MFWNLDQIFRLRARRRLSTARQRSCRLVLEVLEDRCVPADFTVNTIMPAAGMLTFAQAVAAVNASNDPMNTIDFAGLPGGQQTINVAATLALSKNVTIEGTKNQGVPLITLNGGANGGVGGNQVFQIAVNLNVTIDFMRISSANSAASGGAIAAAGGDRLTLNGDYFVNDRALAGGGAVAISGAGSIVNVNGCLFQTDICQQQPGGAIMVTGTGNSLTVTVSNFVGNAAPQGGAIGMLGSTSDLSVSDSEFTGTNIANIGDGGAIFAQTPVVLNSDTFNQNQAGDNGGAVSVVGNTASLTVSACSFFQDEAGVGGGAISTSDGAPDNIQNSGFSSNIASRGGAVRAFGNTTTLTVLNSTFFNNNALAGAGGAVPRGGAIYAVNGTLDVVGSSFSVNQARDGGAIYFNPNFLNTVTVPVNWALTNDSFLGNIATRDGGGVFISLTPGTADPYIGSISGSVFAYNNSFAGTGGGGMSISQDTAAGQTIDTTISNSTFFGNGAAANGGGLSISSSTDLGVEVNHVALVSLTVTQNGAGVNGGGMWTDAAPTVSNSIFASNTSGGIGPDAFGFVQSLGYNLVGIIDGSTGWPETDQTGTSEFPLDALLDPNGLSQVNMSGVGLPATTLVVQLLEGSPALGKGDPNLAGTLDQSGFVRQLPVSVGAYDPDAVNNPPVVGLNSSDNSPVFGQSVTFTATVAANSPQTGTPTGVVEFWDGSTELGLGVLNSSGCATLSTSLLAAGNHTISAIYGGDANFETATSSVAINVNKATPVLTVSGTNVIYNGSPDPATALITGVNGVPGSTLEGVSPTLTYYAGSNAYGTALPGAPGAAGTYSVFASFPGSADYTSTSVNATISETALPSGLGYPSSMIAGPDGNLWFTNYSTSTWQAYIGVMTPGGGVSEFSLPSGVQGVSSLVAGPDGNVWFIEYTSAGTYQIGKVTPSGQFFSYALPAGDTWASYLVAGPGGNLWFIDGTSSGVGHIGQITPSGSVTDFALAAGDSNPWDLIAGPDGDLWYNVSTSSGTQQIVQMTPSGNVTPYSVPAGSLGSLLTGSNGNIWFTAYTPTWQTTIGTITSSGVSVFNLPARDQYASNLTAGPNGNVWFSDSTTSGHSQIAEITPSGQVTDYPLAGSSSYVGAIVAGPDGNVWFSDPRTATARQPEIQMAA